MIARVRFTVIVALGVAALDWASKAIVLQFAPDQNVPDTRRLPALSLLVIVAAALRVLTLARDQRIVVAVGVLAGGALANLLERAAGVPITNFIPLPVLGTCNLADLALAGSSLFLLSVWLWKGVTLWPSLNPLRRKHLS